MENKELKVIKGKKESQKEKILMGFMYLILAFAVIVLLFTAKSMFFPKAMIISEGASTQEPAMSRMTLTSYDKELARRFMDKNNDGKCDACGMPIEMCIDSGMMQCSGMDPDATMGLLGSQHIHADWKIYINDKALNFEGKDHMGRMR